MKKLITIISLLAAFTLSNTAWAQEKGQWNGKRFESIVQIGSGLYLQNGYYSKMNNPGGAMRLSYGLDTRLNETWSVMPGIGLTYMIGEISHHHWKSGVLLPEYGADPDNYACIDVFSDIRYHFKADHLRMVIGLGPALSYGDGGTYYIDANPSDPLNQCDKFKHFGVWLRPSVMFEFGRHFKLGFEGNLGLNNMRILYPEYHVVNTNRFANLMVVAGFGF